MRAPWYQIDDATEALESQALLLQHQYRLGADSGPGAENAPLLAKPVGTYFTVLGV